MATNITHDRKYEQFRIYFNGVLHLHLKLLDLTGFQSWIHGNSEHYIEYTFLNGSKITSAYQHRDTWESVLNLLSEHITVIG